jgi:K(+)-stimulated pyrophosphate-energized sodium pump
MIVTVQTLLRRRLAVPALCILLLGALAARPTRVQAQAGQPAAQADAAPVHAGGEANLQLPDLSVVSFHGVNGRTLLMSGLLICGLGLLFGLMTFSQLKALPVHASMLEVSELIYETCKTYLLTQGKFLMVLEIFIGFVIILYFGILSHLPTFQVLIILAFSVLGILGSYGVAWFGIRVNTFANSRTAFASLRGKP